MLNILGFFQGIVDFFTGLIQAGVNAITAIGDFFGQFNNAFQSILGTTPSFFQPFFGLVMAFCGFALIIKLVPFIG